MKFGKLEDPASLSGIDFSLPDIPARTLQLLQAQRADSFRVWTGLPMWANKAWEGKLFPPRSAQSDYLRLYSRALNGIEMNTTHYRSPSAEQVARWRDMTPPGFRFSPKVPQSISHRSSLLSAGPAVAAFTESLRHFEDRLGYSFLQLPPYADIRRLNELRNFLHLWPLADAPLALEFRHASWFGPEGLMPEASALLEEFGLAAVITDVAGRRDVLHLNAGTGTFMLRFVGNGMVASDFSRAARWVEKIAELRQAGAAGIYLFVHEPDDTLAPDMAAYFIQLLNTQLGLGLKEPMAPPPQAGGQMTMF